MSSEDSVSLNQAAQPHLLELYADLKERATGLLKLTQALLPALPPTSPQLEADLYLRRVLTSCEKLLVVIEQIFKTSELEANGLNLGKLRHDAGNPLNQIIGYSEMLQEEADAQKQTERSLSLQQIQTQAHSLLGVLNDLLDQDHSNPDLIGG
jgi:signal transduction histidine kinase